MEDNSKRVASQYNQDASPTEVPAGKDTSKVRADFEGLLELAENLQQSLEHHSDKYRQSFTAQQGIRFLAVLEFVLIYPCGMAVAFPHDNIFRALFSPHFAVVALIVDVVLITITLRYLYLWTYRTRLLRRASEADDRGLIEVVELLREIEPIVAKEEGLSVLERVRTRIRLARFGVGSSSVGDESSSKQQNGDFSSRKRRVEQELLKPF